MKLLSYRNLLAIIISFLLTSAFANSITVNMNETTNKGTGKNVGTLTITDTQYGLLFTPNLTDLSPGIHGFHIHQNPSCDENGIAAGGHYDPQNTQQHLGPYDNKGHLGDLPALTVNQDGTANLPVLAPRLHKIADINNHALMIHAGGDNYSDTPAKLGGVAGRMVCGVITE